MGHGKFRIFLKMYWNSGNIWWTIVFSSQYWSYTVCPLASVYQFLLGIPKIYQISGGKNDFLQKVLWKVVIWVKWQDFISFGWDFVAKQLMVPLRPKSMIKWRLHIQGVSQNFGHLGFCNFSAYRAPRVKMLNIFKKEIFGSNLQTWLEARHICIWKEKQGLIY